MLASSQDNPDQSDARVLRIVLSLITFLNKAVHSHTAMLVGLTPPPPLLHLSAVVLSSSDTTLR